MTGLDCPDIATLAAVIAHSQIVLPRRPVAHLGFPAGFDDVDIAILQWIAAEGGRSAHRFV